MQFNNPERIAQLYNCVTNSQLTVAKAKNEMLKILKRKKDKDTLKRLFAGRPEELSADVDLYDFPNGKVIVKSFGWDAKESDFPGSFYELAANIVTTHLANTGESLHFVKMHDALLQKETLFMLFEYFPLTIDDIPDTLEDHECMFDLLIQLSMALIKMQDHGQVCHFDLRSDNVLVEMLDEPRQLYKLPYKSKFIVKITDYGQAELQVGCERPSNEDIPRGEEAKWGAFPETCAPFCEQAGYDLQYFIYTLVDVLEGFGAQYYILNAVAEFIEEGLSRAHAELLTSQSRPVEISLKSPHKVVEFMESTVFSML